MVSDVENSIFVLFFVLIRGSIGPPKIYGIKNQTSSQFLLSVKARHQMRSKSKIIFLKKTQVLRLLQVERVQIGMSYLGLLEVSRYPQVHNL